MLCVLLLITASDELRETALLFLFMLVVFLLSLLYTLELFIVLVRVSIPVFRIVLVVLFKVLLFPVLLIALLESTDLFVIRPDSPAFLCLSLVTTEPLPIAGL